MLCLKWPVKTMPQVNLRLAEKVLTMFYKQDSVIKYMIIYKSTKVRACPDWTTAVRKDVASNFTFSFLLSLTYTKALKMWPYTHFAFVLVIRYMFRVCDAKKTHRKHIWLVFQKVIHIYIFL